MARMKRSCLQTKSYCRLLLLVVSAVSSEATPFLTSSSVTVYPSVSSTIVFNAFSSSSGSTVSESTYLPPHKSTSSVPLQSISLTQLESTSSVLYQSTSSVLYQSTSSTSHDITSSVPAVSATVTVHPTSVDVEPLVMCVVFGVIFGIFILVSFTIFCLLLKYQLTNDQPRVRNFMMDKVLITIYDGDVSYSETHSDTHSDDFTDEDSNDSATAPLLSL